MLLVATIGAAVVVYTVGAVLLLLLKIVAVSVFAAIVVAVSSLFCYFCGLFLLLF